ncbi:MAG: MFS transporter [Bacteroidales bacterium]|nr:MFS transporter [Bacteroidales bacterium]
MQQSSWRWVPSLYFAEGLPYAVIISVSIVMYKNLGVSNADIALYTSWFYLPWVIKPLWSPFVDLCKTKRWWIIIMQTVMSIGFAAVAFLIPTSFFFQATIAVLWLMAFASATHDIAADGFYMLAQDEQQQSFFVGVRNIFYRVAMIVGQGFMVMMAGVLSRINGSMAVAWSLIFVAISLLFVLLVVYHKLQLPRAESDTEKESGSTRDIFVSFFRKPNILPVIAFILLYRLGEAQLTKMSAPFLLDDISKGGLAMNNEQVGAIYGTFGVLALLAGGLVGGIAAAKNGLKRWLRPMIMAMNLPNIVYVALAWIQTSNFFVVSSAVVLEQFGYGFGFTAFTLFIIQFSQGEYKTAHYALCTGLMALGMMLPGMISGFVQEALGYSSFFLYVLLCCIPGIVCAAFIKIRDERDDRIVKSDS